LGEILECCGAGAVFPFRLKNERVGESGRAAKGFAIFDLFKTTSIYFHSFQANQIKKTLCLCVFAGFIFFCFSFTNAQQEELPEVPREFRGVWVATVRNIDFPTKSTLTTKEQKQEMIALLDRARELKLNAVLLQVRPMCDAFYQSKIEGWSRYLTGEHGKAPKPFYDPLKFAIEEAHKRGILLHVWFNPYRANDVLAEKGNEQFRLKPEYVKKYGEYFWLDPGERAVQDYSLAVVLDVVKRYDIDGVVFDDYFYPYPITEQKSVGSAPTSGSQKVPFPDDSSFKKYKGKLSRDDWRRDNVNQFIKRVSVGIKKIKPNVLFGISPFGIYRPEPPRITGFDAYAEIYADSLKWLQEGTVDYFAPQLYWTMDAQGHDFGMLLDWWLSHNKLKRHLFPAIYTSKYDATEITNQITATRQRDKQTGAIHFSIKTLLPKDSPIGEKMKYEVYRDDALIPVPNWIKTQKPQPPIVRVEKNRRYKNVSISFRSRSGEKIFRWIVYKKNQEGWSYTTIEGEAVSLIEPRTRRELETNKVAVIAVNRFGQTSKPTFVNLHF
jgi:uncharacterized lipoprotein YddW (UPF0748 family)